MGQGMGVLKRGLELPQKLYQDIIITIIIIIINKKAKCKQLAIKKINYQYLPVNKKTIKGVFQTTTKWSSKSCWCHEEELKRYRVLTRELEAPLPPLFRHDRKILKQRFATLSPDENPKNEKLTNWIELPYPGLARDLNKIEVTKMKGFETGVKDLCKSDCESFQKKT